MFTDEVLWLNDIQPHRLAVTSCPLGHGNLPPQVLRWQAAGVDTVVSLIEPHESTGLGVDLEASLCRQAGITFRSFPIPDHSVPKSADAFATLIQELHKQLRLNKSVLLHCYAGIGRTGIVAACLLYALKVPANRVYAILSESRGIPMPENREQRLWVERFVRSRLAAL